MDYGDKASIEIIRKELRTLDDWLRHATNSTTDDYSVACDRAIELRRKLGIAKEKRALLAAVINIVTRGG